ncbi:hypothetical protein OJAV_G00187580 [Oryzias javanicus]|uniref:Uncharacterized protein n=1 Tax=Oryzias javanicus TaxID=123683 RepID=A0A3S2MHA1_ORYJA|nr:hypothetical protein OJAV_G00187580 [Oryzias javanicus]
MAALRPFSPKRGASGQEQQFMEDKKRKKDDKRKREASQKVTEQKNKVPDLTKSQLLPNLLPLRAALPPPALGHTPPLLHLQRP